MEPKRLSTMHVVTREGDEPIRRYSVALVGGGSLGVRMPASLRQPQAFEIVAQLADLADALEQEHGLLEQEPNARQELLVTAENLREATRENLDLHEAHHLIASYAFYRDAVVEYLRSTRRAPQPDTA